MNQVKKKKDIGEQLKANKVNWKLKRLKVMKYFKGNVVKEDYKVLKSKRQGM